MELVYLLSVYFFFGLLGEIEMSMIGGLLCYKSLWKRFSHIDWTCEHVFRSGLKLKWRSIDKLGMLNIVDYSVYACWQQSGTWNPKMI